MRHYEGQSCGKKDQLYSKLCGNQLLISNIWGGVNGVLIGISVYFSNGSILSVEIK